MPDYATVLAVLEPAGQALHACPGCRRPCHGAKVVGDSDSEVEYCIWCVAKTLADEPDES